MTNGLDGRDPTVLQEQQAIHEIAIANADLLRHALPQVPPQAIARTLVQAIVTQGDMQDVLMTVVDEKACEEFPVWGLRIVRTSDNATIMHVHTRKVLDPNAPSYAKDLNDWLLLLGYATSPGMRIAWGVLGTTLNFYQARSDEPSAPKLLEG